MSLLSCGMHSMSLDDGGGEHDEYRATTASMMNHNQMAVDDAASTAAAGDLQLRTAFQQAQTRARQQGDKISFVYKHIATQMKKSIADVQTAKKHVKELTIQIGETSSSSHSSSSSASHAPFVRTTSDSAHSQYSAGATAVSSPQAYLSTLSSPATSPHLHGGIATSPSMPSLALGSTASSMSMRGGGGEAVDGSYCLLPLTEQVQQQQQQQQDASLDRSQSSSLSHSSSHRAMLDLMSAHEDLHREVSGSASGSRAQSSPVPIAHYVSSSSTASSSASSPQPPSESHSASSSSSIEQFPLMQHVNSASSLTGTGSLINTRTILATSPYSIQPSSNLPPFRRKSLLTSVRSPQLGPSSPRVMATAATIVGGASASSTSVSGSTSHSTAATAAMPSPTAHSAQSQALSSAIDTLKSAQRRFTTLASFCAPLILKSNSISDLREQQTLRDLGVLPRESERSTSEVLSDEDLSASAELDALAQHRVNEGQGAVEEHIISSESEDRRSPNLSDSLADQPSIIMVHSPRPTKEEQRAAMQTYITNLRKEMMDEDETHGSEPAAVAAAASSSASHEHKSNADESVTYEQAVEGCVLLHQLLMLKEEQLKVLELQQDAKVSEAISECRCRIEALSTQLNDLTQQLAQQRQEAATKEEESAAAFSTLQAAHTAALEKNAKLEALLHSLNIPIDEEGCLKDNFHIRSEKWSQWKRVGLATAIGGTIILSSWYWKNVLVFLHRQFPSIFSAVGISSEWIDSLTARCQVNTFCDVATQTVNPVAEALQQMAASSNGSSGSWSTRSSYTSFSITPPPAAAAATSSSSAAASSASSSSSASGFTSHRVSANSAAGSTFTSTMQASMPAHTWANIFSFLVKYVQA